MLARIGQLFCVSGLLGVLSFALLGVTRSLLLAGVTHLVLVGGVVACFIRSKESIEECFAFRVHRAFTNHPLIVSLCGLGFMAGGLLIMIFVEPGDKPNSMSKTDMVYFGSLFVSMGLGVLLIAISDWILLRHIRDG